MEKVGRADVVRYGAELALRVKVGEIAASTAQNYVSAVAARDRPGRPRRPRRARIALDGQAGPGSPWTAQAGPGIALDGPGPGAA
jgi:hypothetical protein